MTDDSAARDAASPGPDASDELDTRAVLTSIGETVYDWDMLSDALRWGANALEVFGLKDRSNLLSGRAYRRLLSMRSPAGRDDLLHAGSEVDHGQGVIYQLRYELILPSGPAAIEDVGRWFAGVDGRPARAHGVVRVLSRSAVVGSHQNDFLGAAARNELMRRLSFAIEASENEGRTFGLFVLSVTGLSGIDDTHGSEVTDELVALILMRLRESLRRTDSAIRYATNRIGILLGRCSPDDLPRAAQRMIDTVAEAPFSTSVGVFPVGLICGGYADRRAGGDHRQILRRAEEAHEQARRDGVSFIRYQANKKRDDRRKDDHALVDEVIRALNDNRLILALQPIVHSKSRVATFHEALVRVRREDGEIISAAAVIPTFEKLGRIELIDQRVLELALVGLSEDSDLSLSINVSTPTLRGEGWLAHLSSTLLQRPDIARRLVVELTESHAIEDVPTTKRVFTMLRSLGVRTAIDDFGAGYTSFKHLRGLDVDILKIDGAFVQNIGRSADDSFFVRTLVELARHLGIETVAEWVRDEESGRQLASWGVTYLQGDYLGRAMVQNGHTLGGGRVQVA